MSEDIPPVCGTVRGFLAHLHLGGEVFCEPCRRAWAAFSAAGPQHPPAKASDEVRQWCPRCSRWLSRERWATSHWRQTPGALKRRGTICRECDTLAKRKARAKAKEKRIREAQRSDTQAIRSTADIARAEHPDRDVAASTGVSS